MNKITTLILSILIFLPSMAQQNTEAISFKTDRATIDSLQLALMRLCYSNQLEVAEDQVRSLAPSFIAEGDTATLRKLAMAAHCQDAQTQELGEATRRLINEMYLYGNPAPELTFMPDDSLKNVILIFYNPECGHCERELAKLKDHYPQIRQSGFRVISIDAGGSEEKYNILKATFPWQETAYFDLEYTSVNYQNYGIFSGLPVIYIIDKNGCVKQRIYDWQPEMLNEVNRSK